MEPLSIALVWNGEDKDYVKNYIDYITQMLLFDVKKPFSRTINLPIFYYSNFNGDKVPPKIALNSEKVIIYVFIGTNSAASEQWCDYVEELYILKNAKIVPIALDKNAYNISTMLQNYNFIREYEFLENKEQQLFISMAHEIYRYGFNEKDEIISGDSALKIFLSHAKEGQSGLDLAKQLKDLIDNNTSMKRFFDSNDIAVGYRFDDEIINNIKNSSIVIINSDIYSSRYWCQREIQVSKEYERPMIEVDLIEKAMDRKFPYAGNVPVVRADINNGCVDKDDLYRILENVLIETVRFNYASKKLEILEKKTVGKTKKLCRPPEMIDIPKILKKNKKMEPDYDEIIYPDPPIYSEEIEFFEHMGIKVYTPIEYGKDLLKGKKVGISVSEPALIELLQIGQNENHLSRLSQMIANYLLGRGATLIYGGDLRKNGFTDQLLQAAQILKDRLRTQDIHLKNYISWPIYLKDTQEVKEWKAKYRNLLEMKEVAMDGTGATLVKSEQKFIEADTIDNCWIWSRSLSKMRYEMVRDCDARICAGGKKVGYKGKMPGVLEEILIAIDYGCPLYLLGGFGGIVHDICKVIQNKTIPESITERWQTLNNEGYAELLKRYEYAHEKIDYKVIFNKLKNVDLKNGLTKEENEILFNTIYADEALQLILKGLQSI